MGKLVLGVLADISAKGRHAALLLSVQAVLEVAGVPAWAGNGCAPNSQMCTPLVQYFILTIQFVFRQIVRVCCLGCVGVSGSVGLG